MSKERYEQAIHAMQTGVKMELDLDYPGEFEDANLRHKFKHLRTGINSALVETSMLAKLLIDKGLLTEAEYIKRLADAMEAEVKRYEQRLSLRLGTTITLY